MNNKKVLFWISTALVLISAILVSLLLDTDRIYTHFFYIPIALSAVVFPKYTIWLGLSLAVLHLFVEYNFREEIEIIALLRASIMMLVSYFLHIIWHKERDYRQRIDNYDYHRYNDALTGAYNQRHLKELDFERLWYPVSLMEIQLEHYTEINARYGQIISDVYLTEISNILREFTRTDDQLLRVHDNVFILLFEHCDNKGFEHVKTRINDQLDQLSVKPRNLELFPEPFSLSLKDITVKSVKDLKSSHFL